MNVDNIIIETTRACNMRCQHCLRGNPQRLSMSRTYLRQFIHSVDYLGTVTFSGGEPTLPSGLKVIEDFLDICNWENKSVGGFYIVTNGLHWRSRFVDLLERLWHRCEENEVSGVAISGDQYHYDTGEHERNLFKWRLEEELERRGIEMPIEIRGNIQNPIAQGRAKKWGHRTETPDIGIWRPGWEGDEIQVFDIAVYLNCKGNIIRGCDFSYIDQDKPENILCHVSDFNEDTITELLEKEES